MASHFHRSGLSAVSGLRYQPVCLRKLHSLSVRTPTSKLSRGRCASSLCFCPSTLKFNFVLFPTVLGSAFIYSYTTPRRPSSPFTRPVPLLYNGLHNPGNPSLPRHLLLVQLLNSASPSDPKATCVSPQFPSRFPRCRTRYRPATFWDPFCSCKSAHDTRLRLHFCSSSHSPSNPAQRHQGRTELNSLVPIGLFIPVRTRQSAHSSTAIPRPTLSCHPSSRTVDSHTCQGR